MLARRLAEPRRFLQVVAGPRQVGKTTLVQQVAAELDVPRPLRDRRRADAARAPTGSRSSGTPRGSRPRRRTRGAVLVLDEIQKIPGWSETVKRLWDEDTRARRRSRWCCSARRRCSIAQGLTESLAGRFEVLHLPHWSFAEMREAFGWSLEQYLFFGGYPGAAPLVGEPRALGALRRSTP